jgi:hypothetical protein
MKIDSTIYLIILLMYYKYYYIYIFNQSLLSLTSYKMRKTDNMALRE